MNLSASEAYSDTDDIPWLLVWVYSTGAFLTLVLNPFALVVIHHQVDIHDVTRLLFRVLMYANIILGISWNGWSIVWEIFNTPRGCLIQTYIFPFVYRSSMMSVTLYLCLISLNKYYLLARPLRYHSMFFVRHTRAVIIIIQSLCCLSCSMFLPIPGVPFVPNLRHNCKTQGHSFLGSWVTILSALNVAAPVLLELVMTTILDILILRIARKVQREIQIGPAPLDRMNPPHRDQIELSRSHETNVFESANREDTESFRLGGDRNVSKPRSLVRKRNIFRGSGLRTKGVLSVILLTVSFYVCWVPVLLFFLIPNVVTDQPLDAIGASSSWVQPLLYVLSSRKARKISQDILRRVFSH